MKRALFVLFGFLTLVTLSAQDRVAVTFKVFPPGYEVLSGGDRLSYTPRGDGLRVYQLPAGSVRINLTAPGTLPLSLGLDVKAGMAAVQAKLEPRQGPLDLVGEASTGKQPRSVAFSTDGKKLFVALQGDAGVDVYEVPSLKKVGRLAPAEGAAGGYTDILVLGQELWTVGRDGRVHAFDAATLAYKNSQPVTGGGNAFLTDLGGGKVAVANWDSVQLFSLDASTRKVLGTLWTGGTIRGFDFVQGTGYAALFDKGTVALVDATTWKVKTQWAAGKSPRPLAVLGNRLFVGDMGSAAVLILDTGTGKVIKTVEVASNPHQMAVSADRTMVAVASRGRNNPADYQLPGPEYGKVTLLDGQGTVLGAVWGRNQPTGLAFSADGKYLAFTDFLDDNVELYRLSR